MREWLLIGCSALNVVVSHILMIEVGSSVQITNVGMKVPFLEKMEKVQSLQTL